MLEQIAGEPDCGVHDAVPQARAQPPDRLGRRHQAQEETLAAAEAVPVDLDDPPQVGIGAA